MEVPSKLSQFLNGIIGESTLAIPDDAAGRFPGAPPDRSERRLVPAANHNAAIGGAGGGAPKYQRQHLRIGYPVALQCGQVYFGRTPRRRLIAGDRRRRPVRCGPWARQAGCREVMWSPALAFTQPRPAGQYLVACNGTTSCNGGGAGGEGRGAGSRPAMTRAYSRAVALPVTAGNIRRNSIAAENSPPSSKALWIAAAWASETANMVLSMGARGATGKLGCDPSGNLLLGLGGRLLRPVCRLPGRRRCRRPGLGCRARRGPADVTEQVAPDWVLVALGRRRRGWWCTSWLGHSCVLGREAS